MSLFYLLLHLFHRLERLDHLAKKFKHKCDIHEGWSEGKEVLLADNDFTDTKLNELRVSASTHTHIKDL